MFDIIICVLVEFRVGDTLRCISYISRISFACISGHISVNDEEKFPELQGEQYSPTYITDISLRPRPFNNLLGGTRIPVYILLIINRLQLC